MCKYGNVFSLLVLIGRAAWPYFFDLQIRKALKGALSCISYGFSGGNGKEETPVPIPNTEVKLFCADGTAWETMWESRTPPKNFYKTRNHHLMAPGFLFN